MKKMKVLLLGILIGSHMTAFAQQPDLLTKQIKEMAAENDPRKSLSMMKKIMKEHQLTEAKDAETIDMMKGNVASDYLDAGNYKAYEKTIYSMRNKFNQTSFMSMGAATLLEKKKDLKMAETLAKKTLDLFNSFKDDPKAKPAEYAEEDWKRFMGFAIYPYSDTYAHALYANGKYKEALAYQQKSFDSAPEEGMPTSVERYAHLLVLNGQEDKAYMLLLNMAETGKSTAGMNNLLKELYVKKGDAAGFDSFFAGLQKNVVATLKTKLKPKMQDAEAPTFSLKDIEGKTVSLSDFAGKIVVIDFWATWCAPCKASFPAMKKAMERHPEVKFLFIATQEKPEGALDRVKNYITQNQYPFHVLMDEQADNARGFKVVSAYKVEGIPAKFVIDAKGRQRFTSSGFTSDTELMNELDAMIQLAAGL